nr:hypothetical protein [Tanacetum cinerariifolium]
MVPPNNLGPDLVGKPVNETSYRGMIGSLMYRKGTPSISLYYLKCLGFDLKGYSESDYVGCNIDRKSTSATCQILGGKLVYWSAKKQQSVAMSLTEAEYVVAAMFCAMMNGKKPLILNYKTFVESTRIDYAKGTYVSYYSPKVVKAELAKIVKNLILLDKTPVLKTTLPMAWRILFTFLFKSSVDPSKVTPIELTTFMVVVNNREHLVALFPFTIKKKKGKSQTGSEQSHLVSSGTVPDTQDPKRNIQLAGMGLPSILDEGTRKSQPLPKGTTTNPKDSEGNIQPADKGLPSTVFNEEHQSPPNTNNPEPSPAQEIQESNSDSSSPKLKKYDNIPPLTERQLTDKIVQATMDSLNKTATDRTNLLKDLNGVTEILKVIQDAVKHDPALNKKSSVKFLQAIALRQEEHIALWAKSSTSMAWNLGLKMTAFESSHAQIKSKISSLRQDTLNIKSMMIEIYQAFKDKEDQIKKAEKEAKRLAMTKTEIIKIVQEEAERLELIKRNSSVLRRVKSLKRLMMLRCKFTRENTLRSLPKGVPFVNNMVMEEPEYGIFFNDVFGDQAFQRWNDIHKVKRPVDDEPMWAADRIVAPTPEVLNAAATGIFHYKTPNQAYQLLEDKVLLKLDWAKNQKTKSSLKKTIAFTNEGSSNSDTDKIMARMDAMTMKMDAHYKELKSNAKKQNPILMKMTYPCLVKKRQNSCKLS